MGSVKQSSQIMSRRALGRSLAGAMLARVCPAAERDQPGRLVWSAEPAPKLNLERRYRADAQVLLFGLTLLRREDVGGGSVLWREYEGGGAARLLEFNGYSTPARAAGLNRLGFIREMARISGSEMPECSYFGLITASPEESAEEARKSLHSGAKEQAYTAIEARLAPGETETAIAHFMAPAALSGANREDLVERARRALAAVAETRTAGSTSETGHSFLQELAGLVMRPDGKEGRYIYAGRPYRLHLTRSVDGKATAYFRERRLIAGSAVVVRFDGRLRREAGGKETEFRLWIPSGAERPLPLRIEYQAKSYLRLVFEAAGG
jgi:hypothetical protein